jgi:parallel beta-helix repeat protein
VGVSGKNGIKIACNNVTLDLAGFCLTGANSLDAVLANVRTNIILRNGNISGWGNVGVDEYASANSIVEHINVTSCSRGIWIGKGVVRDCNCQNNGDTGIECTGGNITGCTASNNGHGNAVATPPELSLYGSYLYDSSGSGIYITLGTVSGCTAQNNGYAGITANGQSTVSGCNVANNYIAGIVLKNNGNQVLENNLQSNDAAGAPGISYDSFINSFHAGEILLFGSNSRIEGNHITGNGLGAIFLLGNYSTVIKNSLINTGFIMSGAHNVLGSVINDSTGAITNASPWGNIVL